MIAIGFDFDHTLAVDHGLERDAFYKLAEELGEPLDPDDVAYKAQIDTLLADFRAGTITLDDAVHRFVSSLHDVHVTEREEAGRYREICYELVPTHVTALPGVPEVFAHLKSAGVPFGVLTNGWSPLQEKKLAAIGFEGPTVISGAVGAAKPDPRAFAFLAEALGAPADAVWYVGDNPAADVAGALAAGMKAIWIDPAGEAYPQHLPPPTLRITELRELINLCPGRIEAVEKRG